MQAPDTPADEFERLNVLRFLAVLDTAPEERFDRLTRIAQHIFQVPIALVSLVDADRQWFKSRQGLQATETPRDISFCGHAILSHETFVVPNALEDPRFADNPLVTGAPDIRLYAGAPLADASGKRVGTLCVIDRHARELTDVQRRLLRDLADCVVAELERTHRQAQGRQHLSDGAGGQRDERQRRAHVHRHRARHHRAQEDRAPEERVRLHRQPRTAHAADLDPRRAGPGPGQGLGGHERQGPQAARNRQPQQRAADAADQRHPRPGKARVGSP
ncbi:MAG: hypothetical protein C0505_10925 [Leptothrix sp. (in: Bacteria)]|nr:hypothetical protein [Leptothrix sp. (in: b-proteobacteria)]